MLIDGRVWNSPGRNVRRGLLLIRFLGVIGTVISVMTIPENISDPNILQPRNTIYLIKALPAVAFATAVSPCAILAQQYDA